MADLVTDLNLPDPDAVYSTLITAHDGLDSEQSEALNARLVLLLVNHIGDPEVLAQAIDAATRGNARQRGEP